MFRQYAEQWGRADSDTLVWFAPSAVMNPQLPKHVVDRALATNPAKARAEFLNVWREDLADFIPPDVVEAAIDRDRYERAPIEGASYFALADAAGGTGSDSFAFAVAHREDSNLVLDLMREYKPRFIPAQVIAELSAGPCKAYGISEVQGDKYAIGFHQAEWADTGISFVACERTTSENYLRLLPQLMAGRVRLINNATLRSQLVSLERKVGAADRESVSHPQHANAHDDLAAAAAGALVAAGSDPSYNIGAAYSYAEPGTIAPEGELAQEYWRGLSVHIYACTGHWP